MLSCALLRPVDVTVDVGAVLSEAGAVLIQATGAIIGPQQQQTQLTLTASEEADDLVAPVRIVGHSDDGMNREAAAATITWGKGGGRDYIRSRISTDLYIATSASDVPSLNLNITT